MKGAPHIDLIRRATRSLGIALRKRRLYPPGSPAVAAGMARAHLQLIEAMGQEPLVLDVLPDALALPTPGDEPVRLGETDLARRLHLARVGRLQLQPRLDASGLADLLALLADTEEPAVVGRRLAEGTILGVRAELLDLGHLFTGGGAGREMSDEIWSTILDTFSGDRDVADAQGVTRLLSGVVDAEALPESLRAYSRADLLSLVMERLASGTDERADTVTESLQRGLREVFERADPETWLEVLDKQRVVEEGTRQEQETVAMTEVGARAFSALQIEELIRYGIGTRPHATPRLYRLFDGLLAPRADREDIARNVGDSLPPGLERSWPGLLDVLNGERPETYLDTDYRATLERPLPEKDLWDLETLRRRQHELTPRAVRARKGRIALSILSRERDPEDYRSVLLALEGTIPAIVEENRLGLLDEVVATLDRHRLDADRGEDIRSAAEHALERLREPPFVDTLLQVLTRQEDDRSHLLWSVLDRLGADCIPPLLARMEQDPSVAAYSTHLRHILADADHLPAQMLAERIRDARGAFARQLIVVLAGTGRTDILPAVRVGLEHNDPGVRRASVLALENLPGSRVELLLLEALSDTALEVRVAALRTFRSVLRDGGDARLAAYLRLSNLTGRHSSLIVAAIRAAEGLQAVGLLPVLEKLSRKPFLFPGRRRAVWRAARRAAARLRAAARRRHGAGYRFAAAPRATSGAGNRPPPLRAA